MHLTLFKANFRSLNTTAYHLATPAGKAETDAHVFIGACQLTRRPIMDKIIHKSNCNNLYSKKSSLGKGRSDGEHNWLPKYSTCNKCKNPFTMADILFY